MYRTDIKRTIRELKESRESKTIVAYHKRELKYMYSNKVETLN